MASLILWLISMLLFLCFVQRRLVAAVTIDDFFPFGTNIGDAQLPDGDDEIAEIQFMASFPFYGQSYSFFGVATNGLLSMNTTSTSYTPQAFPIDNTLIAPYWADADTTHSGSVYYTSSSTTNVSLLNRAADIINTAFTEAKFTPQQLYIVTWIEVDYYRSLASTGTPKKNTFQAVLTADSVSSFVLFLYEEGGIQWTTGDSGGGVNGLGGNPATAGLNAGFMEKFETVTGSNSNKVIDVDSSTNIGIPGMWAFQVNEAEIAAPDPCILSPKACDPNAYCKQIGVTSDFMCNCVSPFTGDGMLCTIPDPCLSNPCDPNAECERESSLSENVTCLCRAPYTVGDGFNCSIPDPCFSQPGPCDINADCKREGLLSEEFNCTCRPPFVIGDGFNCTIPDPCLSQPCHVNASCIREGLFSEEFMCTCDTEFIGNGFDCSPENQIADTILKQYKTAIIIVSCVFGLAFLILLLGLVYGYIITIKKIKTSK